MRKKKEELEALALSHIYDIVGIRQKWWNQSYDGLL